MGKEFETWLPGMEPGQENLEHNQNEGGHFQMENSETKVPFVYEPSEKTKRIIESSKDLINRKIGVSDKEGTPGKINKPTIFEVTKEPVTTIEEISEQRITELYDRAKTRNLEEPKAGNLVIKIFPDAKFGYYDQLSKDNPVLTLVEFPENSEQVKTIRNMIRQLGYFGKHVAKPSSEIRKMEVKDQDFKGNNDNDEEEEVLWWKKY